MLDPNLRWWGSSSAWAGEVSRPAFSGNWWAGRDPRSRRFQQDGQPHRLRVQRPPRPPLLEHTLETPVVPVVGGVPDAEVVAAHWRKSFHSVAAIQAHCLDCCIVAPIPVFICYNTMYAYALYLALYGKSHGTVIFVPNYVYRCRSVCNDTQNLNETEPDTFFIKF